MQSTIAAGVGVAGPGLVISPRSLAAALTRVRDPRRAASVAYPLAAVLSLTVAAILANQCTVLAVAEWAAASFEVAVRNGQSSCPGWARQPASSSAASMAVEVRRSGATPSHRK